jgi:hypothetical protein
LDEPAGRQLFLDEAEAEQGHTLAGHSGLNGVAFVGEFQLRSGLIRDQARSSKPGSPGLTPGEVEELAALIAWLKASEFASRSLAAA